VVYALLTSPKKYRAKAIAPAGVFARASAGTSAGYAAVGAVDALAVGVTVGEIVAVVVAVPPVAVGVAPTPPAEGVHPVTVPATRVLAAARVASLAAYPRLLR
jgi:hypothetical protein